VNPAFTGIYQKSDIRFLYRDQWSKIPGGYSFSGLAFQSGFTPKLGLGLNATQEKAGGAFKNYQVDVSAAYHTELNHDVSLHFGLNIGFLQYRIEPMALTFMDQIQSGGTTLENIPTSQTSNFTIGAGSIFTVKKFWAGLSFGHLNQPNLTFLSNSIENRVKIQSSLQMGYLWEIKNTKTHYTALQPMLFYSYAKRDFGQIGAVLEHQIWKLGMFYKGSIHQSDLKSLSFYGALRLYEINLAYSYDYLMSKPKLGSSHEISVVFKLSNITSKRVSMMGL